MYHHFSMLTSTSQFVKSMSNITYNIRSIEQISSVMLHMIYIQEVQYLVGPSWDQLFKQILISEDECWNSRTYLKLSFTYTPSRPLEQG